MNRQEITIGLEALKEVVEIIEAHNFNHKSDYDVVYAIDYDENGKVSSVTCHNFNEFGRIDVVRKEDRIRQTELLK